MEHYAHLTFLILIATSVPPIYGQLFSNEDTPSLLNRVLQVVWEPSSLIRLWVGLDQLYNIALSWRTVAKKIVSLPFGGSHMNHVRLQEPRRAKYYKPSAASQWERFNEIYSSSKLSPVVAAGARNRLAFNKHPFDTFQTAGNNAYNSLQFDPNSAPYGVPPIPLFFQMQGIITNPNNMDNMFQNINGIDPSLNFGYKGNPEQIYKLLNMQKLANNNILQNKMYPPQAAGTVPQIFKQDRDKGITVNTSPEERLNMFLNLMKTLGEIHTNDISRKSFETGDR